MMSTQNSPPTVADDTPWRFQPGVSGNPGGRPKGLAAYVREQTVDGQALVDKVLYMLEHPKGKGLQAQRFKLECIQWLADRGFGRPVQGVVHGEINEIDRFADVSTEDLLAIVDLAKAVRERQANAIEGDVIEGDGRVLDSDPAA